MFNVGDKVTPITQDIHIKYPERIPMCGVTGIIVATDYDDKYEDIYLVKWPTDTVPKRMLFGDYDSQRWCYGYWLELVKE